ncbi:MAG: DUF4270 family protein [Sphingobacteriales bacterium]|nr:DUF4270 family protein [Sphingobacteriales bacterium]
MRNRHFAISFATAVAAITLFFSACRKINDSTELGGGLIPPVDNITTFDTTISVQSFNDTFGLANDSQYLARNAEHFVGLINNDPFFGKTDAQMFFELKPALYGSYPFARKDSVKIDSIVLVLSYLETYGDTNTAQQLKVYELDQSNNFTYDSAYLIRKENFTYNTAAPLSVPGQLFYPRNLNDSVKAFRDTTTNQLRIKLDTNFARRLFNYDTSNAYKSDSIFKTNFKGFALRSEGAGNAIMGFEFASINTKLAIYYNHPKVGGGGRDTSVYYFFFTSLSAGAQYVKRDYSGTPLQASLGGATEDPIVYMQGSPGTFANIRIPALATLSNRLIHRAELIVEQLYDLSDSTFYAPEVLYLDASDPSITVSNYKFRTIPYDLAYTPTGFDFRSLGCLPLNEKDALGNPIRVWRFNISRYVQHVLTKTQSLYDLRLSAPFTLSEVYTIPPAADVVYPGLFLNPTIAKGRIRVGGGNHPAQRMRLRLIYSKL